MLRGFGFEQAGIELFFNEAFFPNRFISCFGFERESVVRLDGEAYASIQSVEIAFESRHFWCIKVRIDAGSFFFLFSLLTKNAKIFVKIFVFSDAAVVASVTGTILDVNSTFLELFGYSLSQVIGRNVKMLMPESVAIYHDDYMRSLFESKSFKLLGLPREMEAKFADGSLAKVVFSLGSVSGGSNSLGIKYFVGSFRQAETTAIESLSFRSLSECLLVCRCISKWSEQEVPSLLKILRTFPVIELVKWQNMCSIYNNDFKEAQHDAIHLDFEVTDRIVKTSFRFQNRVETETSFSLRVFESNTICLRCEPSKFVLGKGAFITIEIEVLILRTGSVQEPIAIQWDGGTHFVWICGHCNGLVVDLDPKDVQVGEFVGKGASGAVFRGNWKGRDIAVKRFDDLVGGMEDCREEALLLSSFQCPTIVTVIGMVVQDDLPALVMEFIAGGTLSKTLYDSKFQLSWKLRTKIALDVALALEYMHSRYVTHCDVKSDNVLISSLELSDGTVNAKLCDCGSAKRMSVHRSRSAPRGTLMYMAPELLKASGFDVIVF